MELYVCVCVCTDQWPWLCGDCFLLTLLLLLLFASEERHRGIKPLLPLIPSQRKGVKGGEMCVMERYRVPEEKKWTCSLMRTLALMQMGIDYRCRRVRRYLTLTAG